MHKLLAVFKSHFIQSPRTGKAVLQTLSSRSASTMAHNKIYYSDKYCDDYYEYRHVMLPKEIAKLVPKKTLMSEAEWRRIGVQQSQGWVHYMIHEPAGMDYCGFPPVRLQ